MKAILVLCTAAACAWAQPSITPPQIGFAQDKTHLLRSVLGVAGNFQLGDPAGTEVISASFSGTLGFQKTDSALLVFDATGNVIFSADAPAGPALFAFTEKANVGLAYLLSSQALFEWSGIDLLTLPFDTDALSGKVLSIGQPSSAYAALLVQRDDGLWMLRVCLSSGAIEAARALPGMAAPAFLLSDGGILYSDADGIAVQHADGTEAHLKSRLARDKHVQQMGAGWLEARDDNGRRIAIRVQPGREQVYLLPEAGQ